MENDSRRGLGLLKLSEQKQSVFVTVNHAVGGSSPSRGATSNQSVPDKSEHFRSEGVLTQGLLICTEIGANSGGYLHSALTRQYRESLSYKQ